MATQNTDLLFAQLGDQVRAVTTQEPDFLSTPAGQAVYTVTQRVGATGLTNPALLGQSFWHEMEISAYNAICGASDPALNAAVAAGAAAAVAYIARLLVAALGLWAIAAELIAQLIITLFFQDTLEALCALWKQKLGTT